MRFLALLLLPILSFGQKKLDQKISLVDNKMELLAPKVLTKMSDEMWSMKYPGRAKPILVLSDENGEVNLIADLTQQPAKESQIEAFKDFQMEQTKKRRQDAEFLSNGVKMINGRKIGFFKFLSQAVDQKVFNYYFFTIVDGRIMFFTFNCIEKLKSDWEKTADEIVASIKLK